MLYFPALLSTKSSAPVCAPKVKACHEVIPSNLQAVLPVLLLGYVCHGLWMASMLPCLTAEEGICQHLADKFSNDGDLADLFDWINEAGSQKAENWV